ncbi:hypothetical protein ACN47E_002856 [Coniothyrium glycines]
MAPNVDLTTHSPPPPARIPKLKYRNPLPADQSSLSSRDSHDTGNSSIHVSERSGTPDTLPASVTSRASYETANITSPSLASLSSSATSSNGGSGSSTKKKKKASSVRGFFSLKEPSQLALEQFAAASLKQTASKGTSSPTSKHSNTSNGSYVAQKLPSNVPKVNSKWDGIPDSVKAAKKRHSSSTMTRSSINSNRASWPARASLNSRDTQTQAEPWTDARFSIDSRFSVLSNETRNPPNSILSAATSTSDVTVHRDDSSRKSSPCREGFPQTSFYFPEGPMASGALFTESDEANAVQPITESESQLSESTMGGRSSTDDSFMFRTDSPASSTDSVDTVVRDAADNILRKLNNQPQQSFWGAPSPTVPTFTEECVPDSHDFLFSEQPVAQATNIDTPMASPTASSAVEHYAPPRPVQNFSRPMAPRKAAVPSMTQSRSSHRTTPSNSALPTLYETSLASTESLDTIRDDDDAVSIAPSTIAPSELSNHWYESPRERLGLGGRLRMSTDISPWDRGESLASSGCRS